MHPGDLLVLVDDLALAVGFDEGAKLPQWPAALKERGIEVTRDVRRQSAIDVLNTYTRRQGTIY